ncbi:hypothetical protein [Nostocoides sp.]|nr:hypothetical protein [Tetrasphaera sp.]
MRKPRARAQNKPQAHVNVPDFVDVLADLTRRVDSGRVYDGTFPPSPPP